VYKIYNGFNLESYNIPDEEVENFKKDKNILGKPVIYLGNCQKAKGVIEAYEALKGLNAYLVTSGEKQVKIPTLNFNLDHRGYLNLLKASSIVLTMSKMKEGWCKTAHEAMLLKRPVIGSGRGGMKELLEGGKQIICENFNQLREKVEYLLDNPEEREKIGEMGYNYAKNFTLDKFQREWRDLIKEILK
jgi:glycosyltransferase involved in cell wall biosynthesis